jgi:hypothetical protein
MKPKAIRDEEERQMLEHLAPDLDPADMLEEDEEEYRAAMEAQEKRLDEMMAWNKAEEERRDRKDKKS